VARLILDTSGYLLSINNQHPLYDKARAAIARAQQPPVLSPLVLAEIDYMVLAKVGVDAELATLADLLSGAYEVAELDVDDLRTARNLVERYKDLEVGITDAANAVLADRYDTNEILTTDQRHFRAVTPLGREHDAFILLPMDR
jgi:predicted nucleic acid-binding protein